MREIEFRIPGVPERKKTVRARNNMPKLQDVSLAWQRGGDRAVWKLFAGLHPMMYPPPENVKAEKKIAMAFRASGVWPQEPWEGPAEVWIDLWFPPPVSKPQWWQDAAVAGRIPYCQTPDEDNASKLVKDALNKLLWKDDKQVCSCTVRKLHSYSPHTDVRVRLLDVLTFAEWKKEVESNGIPT